MINLDRAQDRLAAIREQIGQFGWTFERIRAWDARDLGSEALAALAPNTWSTYQARHMTPGEVCCLASHRKAWSQIVERRTAWALILEDDARLGPDVPSALRTIENQTFFDCVKLEGIAEKPRKSRGVKILAGPPDIFLMETVSAGAAAYCLSLRGAEKLLRITASMNREADFFIRQYGSTDLVVGELRPFVAWQDRSGSYIGSTRSTAGTASTPWQRLVRRAVRLQESVARRVRFRLLAGRRPVVAVTMQGSSPSSIGQDL